MSSNDAASFRVGLWNANGLPGKLDELQEIIQEYDINYTFICETWIKPTSSFISPDILLQRNNERISTYNTGHYPHGIALLKNSKISNIFPALEAHKPLLQILEIDNDNFYVWFSIQSILFGCFYLPPSMTKEACREKLLSVNKFQSKYDNI